MLRHILTLIFLIQVLFVWSQDRCGTMEYNRYLQKSYPQIKEIANKYARTTKNAKQQTLPDIITIPVVFHILYHENDAQIGQGTNLSFERIQSQVQVMNEDFRKMANTKGFNSDAVGSDTKIQFCLAGKDPINCIPSDGITRHKVKKQRFTAFDDDKEIKSYGYWPSSDYLNIWVCSLASGFIGYTQFPNKSGLPGLDSIYDVDELDGIVIATKTVGLRPAINDKDVYVYGRTVTHETGHWLGLLHTWGDEECGTDYVDDTPVCADANLVYNCNPKFSNCTGPNTRQMIENYMDYSPDICMNIFTNGQTQRMYKTIQNAPNRNKLLNSKGCEKFVSITAPTELILEDPTKNDWITTTSGNSSWSFGNSNSTKYVLFTSSNSNSKDYNELKSPFIDFGNQKSTILSFDLAYPNTQITDSVSISLYVGCTMNTIYLKSLSGKEIISSSKTEFLTFPDSEDFFRINLIVPNGENQYGRLVFRIFSKSNSKMYLKNVNIYGYDAKFEAFPTLPGKGRQSIFNLQTEANYAAELYSVQMKVSFNPPPSDVNFEIFNLNGMLVSEFKFSNSFPQIYSLPVAQLSPGMYFIKTTVNGEQSVAKVIIYYR